MHHFQSLANDQLLELLQANNEGAFTEIFSRYDKRIYAFTLKMVKDEDIATEVVQEVFIRIWKKREALGDVRNLEAYIFTIAANLTLNHIKKRLRDRKVREKLVSEWSQYGGSNADDLLLLHDCETQVSRVVATLPPQQKRVYLLSREEGLNYEEISKAMNISPNTVRNHLVKALNTIRSCMENHGQVPLSLLLLLYFCGKN